MTMSAALNITSYSGSCTPLPFDAAYLADARSKGSSSRGQSSKPLRIPKPIAKRSPPASNREAEILGPREPKIQTCGPIETPLYLRQASGCSTQEIQQAPATSRLRELQRSDSFQHSTSVKARHRQPREVRRIAGGQRVSAFDRPSTVHNVKTSQRCRKLKKYFQVEASSSLAAEEVTAINSNLDAAQRIGGLYTEECRPPPDANEALRVLKMQNECVILRVKSSRSMYIAFGPGLSWLYRVPDDDHTLKGLIHMNKVMEHFEVPIRRLAGEILEPERYLDTKDFWSNGSRGRLLVEREARVGIVMEGSDPNIRSVIKFGGQYSPLDEKQTAAPQEYWEKLLKKHFPCLDIETGESDDADASLFTQLSISE